MDGADSTIAKTFNRFFLRDSTAQLHQKLDAAFEKAGFLNAEHYRSFLTVHAMVVLPAEKWLEDFDLKDLPPDWPERSSSSRIIADLGNLGVAVPTAPELELRRTPAAASGVLYVLEGSRLGGALIGRKLTSGDRSNDRPMRFLSEPRGDWQPFVAWLNGRSWSGGEAAIAVESASYIFSLYSSALQQVLGNAHSAKGAPDAGR